MKRISFAELKDRVLKALVLALTAAAVMLFGTQADAQTRIRDLVTVSGVRSNPVYGYGIVIGLDGTGDQTTQTPFTSQSIVAMLQQSGITLPPGAKHSFICFSSGHGSVRCSITSVRVTQSYPVPSSKRLNLGLNLSCPVMFTPFALK